MLLTADDVEAFVNIVAPNLDTIRDLWNRSINRMVPEKLEKVSRIVKAFQEMELKKGSSTALGTLTNCFVVL